MNGEERIVWLEYDERCCESQAPDRYDYRLKSGAQWLDDWREISCPGTDVTVLCSESEWLRVCWPSGEHPRSVESITGERFRPRRSNVGGTAVCASGERIPITYGIGLLPPEVQAEVDRAIDREERAERMRAAQTAQSRQCSIPEPPNSKAPAAPSITDAVIWQIRTEIDPLDGGTSVQPSHSIFFLLYCRDRMTISRMIRAHPNWSRKTLFNRKRALEDFLKPKGLSLESFFVDGSMFRGAEKMLEDHRARRISARQLAGDQDDPEG